ncbi:GDP-mannose 4,6-dehydratase [Silvibacterium dinghuense]|uniref:GDP-mannose 4,6-dehydratase n=1 Tax=Silvibacterium dinghuense TaxID=1560006 RepID=UPI0019C64F5C|nr:GDP-mannose 4,6-dehydratase [Silvibacterium dinghuense]GGG93164.1 putative sugar dehydratase/epimerase YfnG [Silvibacterium dinghuense]
MAGFWKGKRAFVTGATGLLGGWLVKALLEQEAEVTVLLRDPAPKSIFAREGMLERVDVVAGELESFATMQRAIAEYAPHTVFHLAAQPLVGVAKRDPMGTLRANVEGTWNLLEACRISAPADAPPNILVASSDKAYGSSENLPYLETHPLQGRYPYDVSKSCADLITQMYAATYGLRAVVARCGNLFGGGDLHWSRTFPGVIKATLENEPFLIRSDGHYVRDFLYVKDAAESYLLLGEKLTENPALAGEAFNFSLGEHLTVLEIVETTLGIMGRTDLKPVIQNIASAEIREQHLDASKARKLLGWEPKYAMPEAIRETVEWYREYFQSTAG